MKRLILMRHAKSDWNQGGLTDFERPLNKRGVQDASKMGKWMSENLELPEFILCSSARRAEQTLQLLLLGLQSNDADTSSIEQKSLDALYLASLSTLKDLIQANFRDHDSIMLIAHNPGMDGILLHYCPDAPRTSSGKLMSTANIAEIEFDDLLNPTLQSLTRPKEL